MNCEICGNAIHSESLKCFGCGKNACRRCCMTYNDPINPEYPGVPVCSQCDESYQNVKKECGRIVYEAMDRAEAVLLEWKNSR